MFYTLLRPDLVIPDHLIPAYQKAEEALNTHRYSNGLNIEALNQNHLYSVRLNLSDRLLLTPLRYGEKNIWLVLDVVENHRYSASPYTKKGQVAKYLSRQKNQLEAILKEIDSNPSHKLTLAAEPSSQANETIIDLENYDRCWISFNKEQEAVLQTSLPLAVSGAPGSGKTLTGLSLLEQLATSQVYEERHNPDANAAPAHATTPEEILYVTRSPELTEKVRTLWEARNIGGPPVAILTYEALIAELTPDFSEFTIVSNNHLKEWLQTYLAAPRFKKQRASDSSSQISSDEAEKIIQEFRLLSYYHEKLEAYCNDHSRHSFFTDQSKREQIVEAYQAYHRSLNSRHLHPEFYPLPALGKYKAIVVDEAQDFSLLQLSNLKGLAANQQICYLLDANQSLTDGLSRASFIRRLTEKEIINLPRTYRCPHSIAQAANALLTIKNQVMEGNIDRYTAFQIASNPLEPGQVTFMDKLADLTPEFMASIGGGTTKVAVVTNETHYEEAVNRFQTLVFTPRQIKGLEYPVVISYKLFDSATVKQIIKQTDDLTRKVSQHRRRPTEQPDNVDQLARTLNHWFTAFTRATQTLIVYQPTSLKTHWLGKFIHFIAATVEKNSSQASTDTAKASLTQSLASSEKMLSPEEQRLQIQTNIDLWQEELEKQINQKNTAVIAQIEKKLTELQKNLQALKQAPPPQASTPKTSLEPTLEHAAASTSSSTEVVTPAKTSLPSKRKKSKKSKPSRLTAALATSQKAPLIKEEKALAAQIKSMKKPQDYRLLFTQKGLWESILANNNLQAHILKTFTISDYGHLAKAWFEVYGRAKDKSQTILQLCQMAQPTINRPSTPLQKDTLLGYFVITNNLNMKRLISQLIFSPCQISGPWENVSLFSLLIQFRSGLELIYHLVTEASLRQYLADSLNLEHLLSPLQLVVTTTAPTENALQALLQTQEGTVILLELFRSKRNKTFTIDKGYQQTLTPRTIKAWQDLLKIALTLELNIVKVLLGILRQLPRTVRTSIFTLEVTQAFEQKIWQFLFKENMTEEKAPLILNILKDYLIAAQLPPSRLNQHMPFNILIMALMYVPALVPELIDILKRQSETEQAVILIVNKEKYTPLTLALQKRPEHAVSLLSIIMNLRQEKQIAAFTQTLNNGANALMLACGQDNQTTVKMLVEAIQKLPLNVQLEILKQTDNRGHQLTALISSALHAPYNLLILAPWLSTLSSKEVEPILLHTATNGKNFLALVATCHLTEFSEILGFFANNAHFEKSLAEKLINQTYEQVSRETEEKNRVMLPVLKLLLMEPSSANTAPFLYQYKVNQKDEETYNATSPS